MVIIHLTNEKENIPPNLLSVFHSLLVISISALHKNRIMAQSNFFLSCGKEKNLEAVYK